MKRFGRDGCRQVRFVVAGCNDYNNDPVQHWGDADENFSQRLPADRLISPDVKRQPTERIQHHHRDQWERQKLARRCCGYDHDDCDGAGSLLASRERRSCTTDQQSDGQTDFPNTWRSYLRAPNPGPTLTSVTPGTAPAVGQARECCGAITVVGTIFCPGLTTEDAGDVADKLTPMQQGRR